MFPQYYVPYAAKTREVLQRAQPVERILKRAPGELNGFFASFRRAPDSIRFLPLRAPKGDAAVLVDAKSAQPLKISVVDPW